MPRPSLNSQITVFGFNLEDSMREVGIVPLDAGLRLRSQKALPAPSGRNPFELVRAPSFKWQGQRRITDSLPIEEKIVPGLGTQGEQSQAMRFIGLRGARRGQKQ